MSDEQMASDGRVFVEENDRDLNLVGDVMEVVRIPIQ